MNEITLHQKTKQNRSILREDSMGQKGPGQADSVDLQDPAIHDVLMNDGDSHSRGSSGGGEEEKGKFQSALPPRQKRVPRGGGGKTEGLKLTKQVSVRESWSESETV